jgi:hypothetical protein
MARDNYRVIWRDIEVGSIGLQTGSGGRTFWHWGIDTVVPPPRDFATHGDAIGRADAMASFRRAWDQYAADADRLTNFIDRTRG